jgi:hypothetical protein
MEKNHTTVALVLLAAGREEVAQLLEQMARDIRKGYPYKSAESSYWLMRMQSPVGETDGEFLHREVARMEAHY